MKAVIFVDHEIGFRILSHLLREQPSSFEVLAVVTTATNDQQWWPSIASLIDGQKIPFFIYGKDIEKELEPYRHADIYFLLSWKHIVSAKLLAMPKKGVINLHYSLLPLYRGVYPVNWSIISGDERTGVTYHWVNEDIDAGQIILQESLDILPIDTAKSLISRLDDLALKLFKKIISDNISLPVSNVNGSTINSEYYSSDKFIKTNRINLEDNYTARDFINLLRGKSFYPESRNLYFIDESTGEKIYLDIILEKGDSADDSASIS